MIRLFCLFVFNKTISLHHQSAHKAALPPFTDRTIHSLFLGHFLFYFEFQSSVKPAKPDKYYWILFFQHNNDVGCHNWSDNIINLIFFDFMCNGVFSCTNVCAPIYLAHGGLDRALFLSDWSYR